MLEATVLKRQNGLDVKVYEEVIYHSFMINGNQVVNYSIYKLGGELVVKSHADVVKIDDDSIIISTGVLDFEIRQDRNYRYMAYKKRLQYIS